MATLTLTDDQLAEVWSEARADLRRLLDAFPATADELAATVAAGNINGMFYRDDAGRGCPVGTVARLAGVSPEAARDAARLPGMQLSAEGDGMLALAPGEVSSALEIFTIDILPGDTPATNPDSRRLLGWIEEWRAERRAAR